MTSYQPDIIFKPGDRLIFAMSKESPRKSFTILAQRKDEYILKGRYERELIWHIDYLSNKINSAYKFMVVRRD